MDDENLPEPPGVVAGLTREERVEEFLRMLAEGEKVRAAAAAVALDWSTLYRRRREDPEFAKRWEDAQRIPVQRLEGEAMRRAMRGSDRLLEFLLKSLAPERFGEKQRLELTNPDGSLQPAATSDAERAARVEALLAMAKARRSTVDDLL